MNGWMDAWMYACADVQHQFEDVQHVHQHPGSRTCTLRG